MAVTTKGYITVEIGAEGDIQKFTLDGTVGNRIEVRLPAGKEQALPSFTNIIVSVMAALGVGEDFRTTLDTRLDELEKITPLAPAVKQLRDAPIFITDLGITADYEETEGAYKVTNAAFGFRVEFSGLKLGPIALAGFGVLFEYTPGTPALPPNGKLQTRALPA